MQPRDLEARFILKQQSKDNEILYHFDKSKFKGEYPDINTRNLEIKHNSIGCYKYKS